MFMSFFLAGCANVQYENYLHGNDVMEDVCITEIEQFSINWDLIEFPIDLDKNVLDIIEPIDTSQKALEIGTNIIEELHREGKMPEYTLVSITHSTKDDMWCFEYSIDQRNIDVEDLIECGGTYVTIDGSSGVLIRAWAEE